MEYVVFDLEWNQACFCKASVRKKLDQFPFRLKGEIIQIGAVRVDAQKGIIDQFKIGVKPQFFSVMDKKVMRLTGIDQAALANGADFPAAIHAFQLWCEGAAAFFTWGPDDMVILQQNLLLHELEITDFQRCFDLQRIFSVQVFGVANKQVSLKKAVEHFEIDDEARLAHDALNDAYDTACVAAHLDIEKGVENYKNYLPIDLFAAAKMKKQLFFHRVASREDAFRKLKLTRSRCPECGRSLQSEKIVKWKRGQYILLGHCKWDGSFFIKIVFEKDYHFTWTIRKELYEAAPPLVDLYRVEAEKQAARELAAKAAAQKKVSQVL